MREMSHSRVLLALAGTTLVFLQCAAPARAQGFVQILNTSYPCTHLEVGDTLEIIVDGPANGAITMSNNGGAAVRIGNTGASGAWSAYYPQTTSTVGSYNEVW